MDAKRLALAIASKGAKITLRWTPSHLGIKGNELADILAKKALDFERPKKPLIPLSYLKGLIRVRLQALWEEDWGGSGKGKGTTYTKFNPNPNFLLKPALPLKNKRIISAFTQLKTGIGFLQAYQFKIGKALSSRCFGNCSAKQDTEHLILSCPNYSKERALLNKALRKEKLPLSLPILFNTSKGIAILIAYLESTGIGTAEWYKEKGPTGLRD